MDKPSKPRFKHVKCPFCGSEKAEDWFASSTWYCPDCGMSNIDEEAVRQIVEADELERAKKRKEIFQRLRDVLSTSEYADYKAAVTGIIGEEAWEKDSRLYTKIYKNFIVFRNGHELVIKLLGYCAKAVEKSEYVDRERYIKRMLSTCLINMRRAGFESECL